MDPQREAWLRERSCHSKNAYSQHVARLVLERSRAEGENLQMYRCVFASEVHPSLPWHLGHCPSVGVLTLQAQYLRERIVARDCLPVTPPKDRRARADIRRPEDREVSGGRG